MTRALAPLPASGPDQRGTPDLRGRLLAGLALVQRLPALDEAHRRALAVLDLDASQPSNAAEAIESDVALTLATLRAANAGRSGRARVGTTVEAVSLLGAERLRELLDQIPTFGFFSRGSAWGTLPARLRVHALTTRAVADRVGDAAGCDDPARLAVSSLLHDVGKLVMCAAFPDEGRSGAARAHSPGERARDERRRLGFDHAALGALALRRLNLPNAIADAVEGHHEPHAGGDAGIIAVADMIAHYHEGSRVAAAELRESSASIGLNEEQLRGLMYELSWMCRVHAAGSPLTTRETAVLRQLAEGRVSGEIGHCLGISVSSVRSHLHNIYGKLDTPDRAQAVLRARSRGWI